MWPEPQVARSPLHRTCKAGSAWGLRQAPDPAAQPRPTARQRLGQRTEATEPPVAFRPVTITAQVLRKTGLAHTRCAQSISGATSTRAAPTVSQPHTLCSCRSTSANDEEIPARNLVTGTPWTPISTTTSAPTFTLTVPAAYTHVLARYPAHGPARRLTFAAIPTTFRLQPNGRH